MTIKKTFILGAILAASIVYLNTVYFPAEKKRLSVGKAFEELSAGSVEKIVVVKEAGAAGEPAESYELVKGAASDVMPHAATAATQNKTTSDSAPQDSLEEGGDTASKPSELKGWGFSSLKGATVDSTALSSLISTLGGLNLGDAIESSEVDKDLSVYGLLKPQLTVSVKQTGKDPIELAFGKKNDYLGQRYVKANAREGVYLVDDSTFITLNKGMVELREKTPVQFEDPDVRTVEFTTPDSKVLLTQRTVGEWLVKGAALAGAEQEFKASTSEVGELLRSLKDLRVADYKDGEKESADNGLLSPVVTAQVGFREGVTPNSLLVKVGSVAGKGGEDSGSTFFTFSGAPGVMTTLTNPFENKKLSMDALREKKLFFISSSDIAKLSVTGKDYPSVELSSDGIEWKVNGKMADPVFADDVVSNVFSLEADAYIYGGVTPDFSEPARRIEILKKGTSADKLVLLLVPGKREGEKSGATDSWIGKLEGSSELFWVKDEAVRKASPREETLLMPTPTPSATATP